MATVNVSPVKPKQQPVFSLGNNNLMTLKFKTLTNKEFTLDVRPIETIGNLKALIESMQGVPIA